MGEKAEPLPLVYIQPHFAHPNGVTCGLLNVCMIKCIFQLTTDTAHQKAAVINLFQRVQAYGHQAVDVLKMFLATLTNASKPPPRLTP